MLNMILRFMMASFAITTSTGLHAQGFPNKVIRIVTTGSGGGTDFTSRIIAQGIAPSLGQQVIVENRPGGFIAIETVTKAPPDGHTLLLHGSIVWILPLMQSVPYDPMRDLSPVTLAVTSPNVLIVNPQVPVKSVTELIAHARQRPGQLNYASGPSGSTAHLVAELFKALSSVDIVRIGYKGTAPALTDLIGGRVQVYFSPPGGGLADHIKGGKVRALGVTGARPSELFPELPIIASALPGFETESIYGVFAPAHTPESVISRLNEEIAKVLKSTEVRKKLFAAGLESVGSTPPALTSAIQIEVAKMGKLIREAGIKAD